MSPETNHHSPRLETLVSRARARGTNTSPGAPTCESLQMPARICARPAHLQPCSRFAKLTGYFRIACTQPYIYQHYVPLHLAMNPEMNKCPNFSRSNLRMSSGGIRLNRK
jgi:hypothetical protein